MHAGNTEEATRTGRLLTGVLFLHACATACFVLVCLFLPVSFALTTFKQLIISEGTFYGVDIAARAGIAYKLIIAGMVLVLLFYALFRFMAIRLQFRFLLHTDLILYSATTICLALLQVMGIDTLVVLKILCGIFWLRVLLLLPFRLLRSAAGPLRMKHVFGLCLVFAFFLHFACCFLWGYKQSVGQHSVVVFFVLLLLCCLLVALLSAKADLSLKGILLFLQPLAAIPFLVFLAIELCFYMREVRHALWDPRPVFLVLWLMVAVLMYCWFLPGKQRRFKPGSAIKYFVLPALIFAFVLLAYYIPVLPVQTEMFESANPANSVMNVFRFGKLPVLDFMSSHLLSEQWYGYLYAAVFGFNGKPDFQVYAFLNQFIFLLVLYALFNRIFRRPLLSVYFILLFPYVNEVFYASVFLAVLPFLFTARLLHKPKPAAFLSLFLLLVALMLWKLDTGVAALMASAVYFPLLWIARRSKPSAAAVLKGVGYSSAVLLVLVLVAICLRPPAVVYTHFREALHYFTASQAHGYRQLLDGFVQQFYIYHVLFPAVALCCIIYCFLQLRRQSAAGIAGRALLPAASLFLFLLFLANLQRGLVRHGFAERGEIITSSTFFAALALLGVYRARFSRPVLQVTVFFAAAFAGFVLLKFFPLSTDAPPLTQALTRNFFQYREASSYADISGYSHRTQEDTARAREHYGLLKSFLDKELRPDQTFLDCSNTPILYFYCGRQVPGYFNQNLQNTVDDFLQLQLIKAVDPQQVPVVVFANYPRTWYDATDGIPNVLRYYLIAEYIFDHYRPFEVIGNKSIWVARNLHPQPFTGRTDTLLTKTDTVNFNLLAEYNGKYYNNAPDPVKEELVPVKKWMAEALQPAAGAVILRLDSNLLRLNHCYLDITFEQATTPFDAYAVQLLFTDTAQQPAAVLSFVRRDWVSSRYMVRLSNHYFWHRNSSLLLHITPAAAIKQVSILKDKRL